MHRLLAAVALSSCLALPLAAAHAQSPAEARAEAALAQLSARYQQIWATLTPAQRQAFSASERRWLHSQRDRRSCIRKTGLRGGSLRRAGPLPDRSGRFPAGSGLTVERPLPAPHRPRQRPRVGGVGCLTGNRQQATGNRQQQTRSRGISKSCQGAKPRAFFPYRQLTVPVVRWAVHVAALAPPPSGRPGPGLRRSSFR